MITNPTVGMRVWDLFWGRLGTIDFIPPYSGHEVRVKYDPPYNGVEYLIIPCRDCLPEEEATEFIAQYQDQQRREQHADKYL